MLIIITGPSGVGKTTIIRSLIKADPKLRYSVSLTTRKPRPREIDGVDYHFVSIAEFKEKIKNDEFAEWSEVYGQYYGRLKRDLEEISRENDVLVGIDVQGAEKLKAKYPEGVTIFILPKSESALESQLKGRGTESEESIKTRLNTAIHEIKKADIFDYKVVNDKVFEAVKKIQCIIIAEKCKTKNRE